jgi:hypothetical protein
MKTLLSIVVPALFLTSSLCAQNSIEILVGTNIANMTIPDNLIQGDVWSSRFGFAISSSVTFDLLNNLTLSPGVRFIQKGINAEFPFGPGVIIHASTTNNYAEIPVYFNYKIYDSSTRVFIQAGPTYSFLLASNGKTTSDLGDWSSNTRSEYESHDFSLDFGLRTETIINSEFSFVATLSFSRGLINISASNKYEQTRDFRLMIGLSRIF